MLSPQKTHSRRICCVADIVCRQKLLQQKHRRSFMRTKRRVLFDIPVSVTSAAQISTVSIMQMIPVEYQSDLRKPLPVRNLDLPLHFSKNRVVQEARVYAEMFPQIIFFYKALSLALRRRTDLRLAANSFRMKVAITVQPQLAFAVFQIAAFLKLLKIFLFIFLLHPIQLCAGLYRFHHQYRIPLLSQNIP